VQWRAYALPAPTPGQWYSIDITDLYNAWQAGTYPNYGVQLRPVSTNNTWAEFYSANYADDPALRPRLVVEPGTSVPGFSRISDNAAPRHFHCAAKLDNGKVLIVGGYGTGTSNPLSSAELYDPATHTFAPTGSMNVSRGRPQCVTLSDGRVLVGGGATAPFTYTNSAEVYNPTTGTFTTVGNMTTPRGEGWHAFAVPGGALLFGGTFEGIFGTATAAVDRFDSGSNAFSQVGTLLGARRDHNVQMLADGAALLVGGVLRFDLPVSPTAELYDLSTNQPIAIGQPIHTPRVRSWSSAVLPGGDVLVTSGAGFPSEIYKTASRSFEALNGAPTLYAADFGSAVSFSNGKVLLLGYGRASGQGGRIAEIFDPAGGTFTAVGPMAFPSECQGYAATALDDGTVLITGGGTPGNCGQGTPVAEIFNPNDL
jgi:Kelch motif